jgi:hypothetical protein
MQSHSKRVLQLPSRLRPALQPFMPPNHVNAPAIKREILIIRHTSGGEGPFAGSEPRERVRCSGEKIAQLILIKIFPKSNPKRIRNLATILKQLIPGVATGAI